MLKINPRNKNLKRLLLIFFSGIRSLTISASNIFISYTVIYFLSAKFWGEFIFIIIIFDLGFMLVSWGNTPYLMREYSMKPKEIAQHWMASFAFRLFLLALFLSLLIFIKQSIEIKLGLLSLGIFKYCYQSFDALIKYNRDFKFSSLVEIIGLITIIFVILIFRESLSIALLIFSFSVSYLFKSVCLLIYYRTIVFNKFNLFKLFKKRDVIKYYKTCFPFFMLSASGMLESRIDLYVVALFLTKSELGQYQVLLNFLNLSMFFGSLILSPFIKNIFRLQKKSLRKLEILFQSTGVIYTLLLIIILYFIINFIYYFNGPIIWFILGFFYVVIFFFYLLKNYELGKLNQQVVAAKYDFSASLVKLTGSLILTTPFRITGALAAGVISKIFLAILYNRKVSFK